MMDARDFQLYLLSRMRAAMVDDALASLGAARADALAASDEARRLGLEDPGHAASLYTAILGIPAEIAPESLPADSPFLGSRALWFHLPLWPELAFVVREHPTGYAWGHGFQRRSGATPPRLATAADLVPWSVVTSEVTARFGTPTTGDAWSGWEDLIYEIPVVQDAAPTRMILSFDLELLQSVRSSDGT